MLRNEPLEAIRVPIDAATLVVGGGIAGIQSALEVAEAGSLAGRMRQKGSMWVLLPRGYAPPEGGTPR